jgi:glycosyltransferase involved in cell wall biosynthesis
MPVYNSEAYVAEAVESILGQTFRDFEFLIIDDGATDRSLEILRRHERQDPRIRLISRENRGLIKTRNELLAEARGELVAWADSDDISYPNRLERQVACFRENPAVVWCQAMIRMVDQEGWPIRVRGLDEPGFTCVAVMRRETAIRLGGFREQLRICEDRDLALRMAEFGEVAMVREVLLDYRQHLGSLCNMQRQVVDEYVRLVDQLAEERRALGSDALQRGEFLKVQIPAETREPEPAWQIHSSWAWSALLAGNVQTARKHAWRAVREKPASVETWRLLACALRGY